MKRTLFCLGLLVVLAGAARADNWPQWRGPNNDGICNEKNLPVKWSQKDNVAWTLDLPGMGGSTPAIWKDKLFLTCDDGKDTSLLCVSTSGKEVWKKSLGPGSKVARGDEGNGASASPSTDGKCVYVFAGNGNLAAFDLDGKEVWKFNTQDRYGKFRIQFGLHSTPVLDGDRLYMQLIHDGGGQVICIDKADGKEVWKVKRPSDGKAECLHSYASCMMYRKGETAYLVAHGNDYATAHDLKDGHEIWRVGDLNPKSKYNFTLRFVASPVCTPDLIVVPSAKDGPVVGVKPDAKGTFAAGSQHEQWRRASGTPDVPCPLVHDGLVYLCGERGSLICMDAKTGAEVYAQKLHASRYRASPVLADGKLYLTARDGTVSVVKAGKTFELLAVNKLPDDLAASPAVSNGRIYLHGFKTLWAIGGQK